jgi:exodeoxyribonuclease VIII
LINSPNSKKEVSGFWIDAFGVACKLRADILNIPDRIIVDYKSTKDASKRAFKRDIFYRGYDIQAAMYLDGVKKILNTEDFINYLWIAQEKTPPYGVAVYRADTELIEQAFDKINKAKPLLKECLKTGKWQGYEDKVQNIMPYGWS